MTKEEAKKELGDKTAISRQQAMSIIDRLSEQDYNTKVARPETIQRGDMFLQRIGTKFRPCVVIRVMEESVLYVPLTTTNNCNAIMECTSRFFKGSYFTNSVLTCPLDHVFSYFIGVYGRNSDIPKLKRVLKKYLRL